MDMPRTREQLQQVADAAERWLDSLDPAAIASPDADPPAEKVRTRRAPRSLQAAYGITVTGVTISRDK